MELFMFKILFLLPFLIPSISFASCDPSDLYNGKASVEIPKPKNFFSGTPKPSPELIEEAKSLAKLNALNNYVSVCVKDRTKMNRYLSAADKVKSKVDLIVNIEREKQTQNNDKKTLDIRIRASVNATAFDAIIIGQNKLSNSSASSGKKWRMVSFFVARKADSTDTKIFDDKVTKITKNQAGVTAEKSATTDGTTTAMNKEGSSFSKTQTGGSTVKKQRASKRNWTSYSSGDLNASVQKILTDNGLKGGKYSYFAKKCEAPTTEELIEGFAANDTLDEELEAAIFDAILESDSRYCSKRNVVAIGSVSYNTAVMSKTTGKYTVMASVRVQIIEVSEDDGPEVIASIGPVKKRTSGDEDNEAEKNSLILAGKVAAEAIVDTLKSR